VRAHYLEDFAVGQTFGSGTLHVSEGDITAFAAQFDPQPFHMDSSAARETLFGGLVASGWHTTALMMRLLVGSDLKPAGGLIGAGVDELRWPKPVRPGDTLRLTCEIVDMRPSRSRPRDGLLKVRMTMVDQHDEPVLVFVANLIVRRRGAL
jgi:acyl dehydratase